MRSRVQVISAGAGSTLDSYVVGGAGEAARRALLGRISAEIAQTADESAEGVAGRASSSAAGIAVRGAGSATSRGQSIACATGSASGAGAAGEAAKRAGLAERAIHIRAVVVSTVAGQAVARIEASSTAGVARGASPLVEEVTAGAASAGSLGGDREASLQFDALTAGLIDIGAGLARGADESGPSDLVAALLAANVDRAGCDWALQAVLEQRVVGIAGEAGGAGVLLRALAVGQAGRAPLPIEEVRARTSLSRGHLHNCHEYGCCKDEVRVRHVINIFHSPFPK